MTVLAQDRTRLGFGALVIVLILAANTFIWDLFVFTGSVTVVHQGLLRVMGLAVGGLVYAVAYIVLLGHMVRGRGIPVMEKHEFFIVLFFLGYAVLSGAIGLAHGNNVVYMIGDTYKLSLIPLSYFLTLKLVRPEDVSRVFFYFMLIVFVSLFLDVVELLPKMDQSYKRVGDYFWTNNILMFCFVVAFIRYGKANFPMVVVLGVVFIVTTASSILSFHRTIFAVLPVILLFSIYKTLNYFRNVAALVVGTVFVAVLVGVPVLYSRGDSIIKKIDYSVMHYGKRFSVASDLSTEASYQTKIEEIRAVSIQLNKFPPAWIIGMGSGAEYEVTPALMYIAHGIRTFLMETDSDKIHHVHIGYVSVLFRYGILGLLLYLLTLFSVLRYLRNLLKENGPINHIIVYTAYIYLIVTMIVMFTFPFFIGDLTWGVLLALIKKNGELSQQDEVQGVLVAEPQALV